MPSGVYEGNKGNKGYWLGKKREEKTKIKISKAHTGKHHTEETKKRLSESHKGINTWAKGKKVLNRKSPPPFSEEHRKKLSETSKGNKNNLGKKQSKETITKRFAWRKGYKHSKETKKKMSLTQKGRRYPERSGKNHYNWRGGISSGYSYPGEWTDDLKESIRKRDNYVCQLCGVHQEELNKTLDVHHIDYDKDNLNPDNLITLCKSCHMKTNFNRDYWLNYFK